jgi:hypothetical protein
MLVVRLAVDTFVLCSWGSAVFQFMISCAQRTNFYPFAFFVSVIESTTSEASLGDYVVIYSTGDPAHFDPVL